MSRTVHPRPWTHLLLVVAAVLPACADSNPEYLHTDAEIQAEVPARDVAAIDAAAVPNGIDLRTGLVGYWRLDDRGDTARDSSGNGLHGTLEGLQASAWVPAWRGGGLRMTYDDDQGGIRIDHKGRLDGLRAYTLAVWTFRLENRNSSYDSLISRQVGTGDSEVFNLIFVNGFLRAYRSVSPSGTSSHIDARAIGPLNRWVHAAVTWDGRLLVLYQDGVEVDRGAHDHALATTATPLYVGTNINQNDPNAFAGTLDEVLVYSRALSPEAIRALAGGEVPAGL